MTLTDAGALVGLIDAAEQQNHAAGRHYRYQNNQVGFHRRCRSPFQHGAAAHPRAWAGRART